MIALIYILLLLVVGSSSNEIWVDYVDGNINYSLSKLETYAVYGSLSSNVNSSSWNYIDLIMSKTKISTKEQYVQSYEALGFAEGFLTCTEINQYYANFASDVFGKGVQPGAQTIAFIEDNYKYLLKMVDENKDDDYWFEISLLVAQINGMTNGYIKASCVTEVGSDTDYTNLNKASITKFLLLMSFGDLYQIALKLVEPGQLSRYRGSRNIEKTKEKHRIVERCSALIKLVHNDILFSHNTWDSYETATPRIFKHLSIPIFGKDILYNTYFSSSPGLISSVDDFYTVQGQANLAVVETTNNLYDVSLLKKVVPSSVLSYMRVMVANKMATDGKSWAELFKIQHSGTYTNQWMVLDVNRFEPGQEVPQKEYLFTVLEEVPGLVVYKDQTKYLYEQTYWPSYNYPFYKEIQEASGYQKLCDHDPNNCYDTDPRATIFKASHASVQDISSMMHIMQLNDWQSNPLSLNDSCNAIACRGDLEPEGEGAGAFGAIDVKVSSLMSISKSVTPIHYVKVGPTIDLQPVFCWSDFKEEINYTHKGSPDCYDFHWQQLPI